MLSQADLPRVTKEKNVGEVVGAISRPPRGPRISGGDLAETDPADASGQTSSPSGTESRLDEESKR
jgi:hypothetical protein